ncbi:MAG: FCD domain-containing protein [Pseudotabrizicola sp.]|uniref:GntR family transcriptional regulator n=1 Tax=Pseudotabrizicola sp. TaxID=2939647 RepID=UPI002721E73D|nr:FCD domain-containing protein [Pseudotabrizicola sp.]MDO8883240.1 FCD domain-containing protein [Pseudotabrizicola sp.]MDP2080572.1 FCD domain-containing protein [Pseudotabrizicola sp.]MDZ7573300.1 FCD domain-containing protein [Pseudotabrizicola sp.]
MKLPDDLQSEQAFTALLAALRMGKLRSSEFHTMPALAEALGFPVAATREAIKRAEAQSLVEVLPKRGFVIMSTGPETTRACMDMRAALEAEGVRRLLSAGRPALSHLRATHEALLDEARTHPGADLSRRALATDLSLHDFMAGGLDNIFLRQAYEANRNRITVIQNARAFLPDRVIPAMEEHLAIIDAIDSASAEASVIEIERHLRQTLRWWGISAVG